MLGRDDGTRWPEAADSSAGFGPRDAANVPGSAASSAGFGLRGTPGAVDEELPLPPPPPPRQTNAHTIDVAAAMGLPQTAAGAVDFASSAPAGFHEYSKRLRQEDGKFIMQETRLQTLASFKKAPTVALNDDDSDVEDPYGGPRASMVSGSGFRGALGGLWGRVASIADDMRDFFFEWLGPGNFYSKEDKAKMRKSVAAIADPRTWRSHLEPQTALAKRRCGAAVQDVKGKINWRSHRNKISKEPRVQCIASFPGKYPGLWRDLESKVKEGKRMSVACVFLPDKKAGLGCHAKDPLFKDGRCYCSRIYGERDWEELGYVIRIQNGGLRLSSDPGKNADEETVKKNQQKARDAAYRHAKATNAVVIEDTFLPETETELKEEAERRWLASGKRAAWGCKWFHQWERNIELAVARNQQLVVYFNKGEKGKGKKKMDELTDTNVRLWDGVGLGGSQKVEVAYLDHWIETKGPAYKYVMKDVSTCFVGGVHKRQTVQSGSTSPVSISPRSADSGRNSRTLAWGEESTNQDFEETGSGSKHVSDDADDISDVDSAYTDFSDLAEMVTNPMKAPIFVILQVLLCWPLWCHFKINGGDFVAGLDSLFPGQTDLKIFVDCEDLRKQLWRWLSYQFTHAGISHIGFNTFMLLFLGAPLEGFHGHLHFFLMFEFGVFGAACCFLVTDPHGPSLVGMSGGCYSLLGIHMADLIMNFQEKEKPRRKLAILVMIAVLDLVNVSMSSDSAAAASPSHWAHLGGYVAGLLVGIVAGRNIKKERYEIFIWSLSLGAAIVLTVFCLAWIFQWAPRSVSENVPWCWSRQVSNSTAFGTNEYQCVRCGSVACIEKWTKGACAQCVLRVSRAACEANGGWRVSG